MMQQNNLSVHLIHKISNLRFCFPDVFFIGIANIKFCSYFIMVSTQNAHTAS